MNLPFGLQLYSVRDELCRDFDKTLHRVAEIGYKGVEFAGFENKSSKEILHDVKNEGLQVYGSHVDYEDLVNNIDQVIDFHTNIGCKYIACPYAEIKNYDDLKSKADKLNKIGEKLRENGIELCYHNHYYEFQKIDNKIILDSLMDMTSSDNLKMELDIYWTEYSGYDSADWIKKYSARCKLIHLKDMDDQKKFSEIGTGTLNIKKVLETGIECNAEYFIVEQDECKLPEFDSIDLSLKNLKKL